MMLISVLSVEGAVSVKTDSQLTLLMKEAVNAETDSQSALLMKEAVNVKTDSQSAFMMKEAVSVKTDTQKLTLLLALKVMMMTAALLWSTLSLCTSVTLMTVRLKTCWLCLDNFTAFISLVCFIWLKIFSIHFKWFWTLHFSLTLTFIITINSSLTHVSATLSQFICHRKFRCLMTTKFRRMIDVLLSWNESIVLFWMLHISMFL